MGPSFLRQSLLSLVALVLMGCSGIHLYDRKQEPVVEVGPGLRPVIQWTPPTAYELSVYEGSENLDGFDVLWSAHMGGSYENTLQSPVTYGLPPAGSSEIREVPPLEEGKTYTIVVFRKDPKGSGDGFFNTRHRYEGQVTFVAQPE